MIRLPQRLPASYQCGKGDAARAEPLPYTGDENATVVYFT